MIIDTYRAIETDVLDGVRLAVVVRGRSSRHYKNITLSSYLRVNMFIIRAELKNIHENVVINSALGA